MIEKKIKTAGIAIGTIWALSMLVTLAVTGVFVWAIIKLVQHFCK